MSPVYKLSNNSLLQGRQLYTSMLAGNTAYKLTGFESIATVTVGSGGASNVEFTSISGSYQHLQVRLIARTDRAATGDAMKVQFNGVTTSSYAFHQLLGDGSNATSDNATSQSNMLAQRLAGATANSNVFGAIVIDILDYTNTNKNTTIRNLGGADNNGDGFIVFSSGLYNATTAVTSIKFLPNSGSNFLQHSHFALYGIRG